MQNTPGAQFEILDRRQAALLPRYAGRVPMEGAEFLKSCAAHSQVVVRGMQSGEVTTVMYKPG